MQLVRLSLENWRGVTARDIKLAAGVTLIEGPNEIGKSTVVEAIRMLFSEMDSSNKKNVKAIQPVGQDVGSRVEAEIKAGDYHFVYAKTYNRSKQTSLDIIAPTRKQLTGREAHEAVEQMLATTVDMALWEALLVDQGEKVALANIQDSAGLAKALDEAAGSTATGAEDTGIYGVVQAEYEKYFTLKTAKTKFGGVEASFEMAKNSFENARLALEEVEADAAQHQRSATEVRRLQTEIPALKAKLVAYEKNWNSVRSLRQKVEAKEKELESAQILQKAAFDASNSREELVGEIQISQTSLASATAAQGLSWQKAEKLKERAGIVQLLVKELRQEARNARSLFELAQEDARYVQNLDRLGREKYRIEQLEGIAMDMKASLKAEASSSVTEAVLEKFREAEGRINIARSRRDTAATTICVTAQKALVLELDDESIALHKAAIETRAVTSELHIRLPGVAHIKVTPSHSVSDLQEEAQEAEAGLSRLADQFVVKNLREAVAANQQRAEAQREIDRLKTRQEEILQGTSKVDIEQVVATLQVECDSYLERRKAAQAMPATIADATRLVSAARVDLSSSEAALEDAQEKAEDLQKQHDQADAGLRLAEQELAGLSAALKDRQVRLDKSRMTESDQGLASRAQQASAKLTLVSDEFDELKASLLESSPESVEALLINARDVFERAKSNLIDAETNLAVLTDRLQQAQADGRYEVYEASAREFEECQSKLNSTRRRAGAVELLWSTLNKYRDATRQAYVKPLKEAIERLGAIVFGAGFEVVVGDDWTLQSRTLNGKTLPFEDLSVGAKEQLGILARLAVAQIVSTQGGVPLIIDDALGFSDPARLETMGAAIAAAGKHCQIIILTCTPGRFMHVGSAKVEKF